MQQDEVMNLFKSRAVSLEKTYTRQQDLVDLLAKLMANSRHCLPSEDWDAFIDIGAALYKNAATQARARAEVKATMEESHSAYDLDHKAKN